MRRRPIKVYEVSSPSKLGEQPALRNDLALVAEGSTIDNQRDHARAILKEQGFAIRSLSNTVQGELLAYVFPAVDTPLSRRTVKESVWNPERSRHGHRK